MKKLLLVLLVFLLGVNGALFWQTAKEDGRAACPAIKKTATPAGAVMVPVTVVNIN